MGRPRSDEPVKVVRFYSAPLEIILNLYYNKYMKKSRFECKVHGISKTYYCRICNRKRVYEQRRKVKEFIANLFGGKCQICGYDRCMRALQFHHVDPSKKDFSLSSFTKVISYEKLLIESKKCVLLCGNCHSEVESGVRLLPSGLMSKELLNKIEKEIEATKNRKKIRIACCSYCNNDFAAKKGRQTFCSQNCHKRSMSSMLPSKETLKGLLWKQPTTHIAKLFDVSDKAVEKWAKKYNLTKPPRGYWSKKRS